MAPLAKQFSFVLLMVLLFTSGLHVEARDGKFLFVSLNHSHHKKIHEKSSSLETPTPAPAPAPVAGGDIEFAPVPASPESGNSFAPAPAPSSGDIVFAPSPLESGNGNGYTAAPVPAPESFESDNPYGLYGKDNEENEFLAEEFSSKRLPEYNNAEPYNNNNGYDNNYGYSRTVYNSNNGYANNYNNNGYSSTYNNYNKNGYSSTLYNNMGYSNSNYEKKGYYNNGYEVQKQGMSDTRFLEKGKYFHNPNHPNQENYNQIEGYESESVRGSSNEGYYGEKSKYEFESMDEYERQQGYSP